MKFVIRPMEEKDLEVTLKWRNDLEVLKNAQTPQPISEKEHEAVFKYNNAVKLIFEVDSTPAGFVSCTRNPDIAEGEWSFHMSKEFRGKGLSEIMLQSALYYLKKEEAYEKIYATVRKHNNISKHLHYKLGFNYIGDKDDFFEYSLNL